MAEQFFYRQNPNFPHRYISPSGLENFLQQNLSDCLTQIGSSFLGKPIYMLSLGRGKTKVLAWSQMHGNESAATHALLDLWESLKFQPEVAAELFSEITLDFIPMLNPDGSEKWTRVNAQEIDLNRDFHQLQSAELPLLLDQVKKKNYDYALNLHEQRTIFSTDGSNPATLSFLAPSENEERDITGVRRKTMAVISAIVEKISPLIPGKIARYSDEFYPNSVGDNFTKAGLPTVLFEGGHYSDDYYRKNTRRLYTIAFYEALKAMANLNCAETNWEKYFDIPENKESHFDLIYRNVSLNTDFPCVMDIAVQYREEKRPGEPEISFEPVVVKAGDLGEKKGWKEIDCIGKFFKSKQKFPKIDAVQNFEIVDQ